MNPPTIQPKSNSSSETLHLCHVVISSDMTQVTRINIHISISPLLLFLYPPWALKKEALEPLYSEPQDTTSAVKTKSRPFTSTNWLLADSLITISANNELIPSGGQSTFNQETSSAIHRDRWLCWKVVKKYPTFMLKWHEFFKNYL